MARIICITGNFPIYDRHDIDTGKAEFVVSHGINEDTDKPVILPAEHPSKLGAEFDEEMGEWVIPDAADRPKPARLRG